MTRDTDPVRIAVLEEQMTSMRREILVQATEYQRRLLELNHAHDKQVADQQTYVSSDRYEGWQGEINAWKVTVSNKLAELEGRNVSTRSALGIAMQVLPMIIAILAILAGFFWHSH